MGKPWGDTSVSFPTEDAVVIAQTRKLGLSLEGCAVGRVETRHRSQFT